MPSLARMQPHIFLKISSLLLNDGPGSVWNSDKVRKKESKGCFKAEKYLSSGDVGKNGWKQNWTTHIAESTQHALT